MNEDLNDVNNLVGWEKAILKEYNPKYQDPDISDEDK